jgi:hypothetical protein
MYRQVRNPDGTISNSVIQRVSDDAFIPTDPDNTDFLEYQKWLAAGNTPLPPEGQ